MNNTTYSNRVSYANRRRQGIYRTTPRVNWKSRSRYVA